MSLTINKINSQLYPVLKPIERRSNIKVYGVEWDGSETTVLTRTDGAENFNNPNPYTLGSTNYGSPFDNIMPWAGIERVTNEKAGELVKIPKFWFRMSTFYDFNESYEEVTDHLRIHFKLQIANGPIESFFPAPAFMDRGDGKGERDYVYVGRYHCNTSFKSVSGDKPRTGDFMSDYRTYIHNLNANIYQWDYAMLITIQMLYLVEFANWDVQSVIGGGCSETTTTSTSIFNCGGTDLMPYHTGTMSINHSDYGNCQYRFIENLWGNCYDWIDGIYSLGSNGQLMAAINPNKYDMNYTKVGISYGYGYSGYISSMKSSDARNFQWFYYPYGNQGQSKKYISDTNSFSSQDDCFIRVGGYYQQSLESGLFYMNHQAKDYSYATRNTGCRLQYLP